MMMMMMMMKLAVLLLVALATVTAQDPGALQDICVADLASPIKVNGFVCKPDSEVSATDFFSNSLANPSDTNNTFGSMVTVANVEKIPGLNTLGISMERIDFAPGGLDPPHTHPRASEMVFVLEGSIYVGFITTADVLISKTINKGETFALPRGLVHFLKNNGNVPAAVITSFNSQLPGEVTIPLALFASSPTVPDNVLAKAFQISTKEVQKIKAGLAPKK